MRSQIFHDIRRAKDTIGDGFIEWLVACGLVVMTAATSARLHAKALASLGKWIARVVQSLSLVM